MGPLEQAACHHPRHAWAPERTSCVRKCIWQQSNVVLGILGIKCRNVVIFSALESIVRWVRPTRVHAWDSSSSFLFPLLPRARSFSRCVAHNLLTRPIQRVYAAGMAASSGEEGQTHPAAHDGVGIEVVVIGVSAPRTSPAHPLYGIRVGLDHDGPPLSDRRRP